MNKLNKIVETHLRELCVNITNRYVGSQGNILAAKYFESQLQKLGWPTKRQEFEAFDWHTEGATLEAGGQAIEVMPSPYSLGCDVYGSIAIASTLEGLESINAKGRILVIRGSLAKEQLMPKGFVFYNPDHHKKTVSLLEGSDAKAIIFLVSKSGFHEGGEYPFPIIEDGDFNIPSVFMPEEDGEELMNNPGQKVRLISKTSRTPSRGFNVIGTKGNEANKRIVITAHIDSKKGSPGAIDNATGITTLLLVAQLLEAYEGEYGIEIVALNGEDYYSVPGQMAYIEHNRGRFGAIALNINIDGAGIHTGKTSLTGFNLPPAFEKGAKEVVHAFQGLTEGKPWVQGDHSIFLQFGVPAIAISSEWLIDNLESQHITHTPKDNIEIVDPGRLVKLAKAISLFIHKLEPKAAIDDSSMLS